MGGVAELSVGFSNVVNETPDNSGTIIATNLQYTVNHEIHACILFVRAIWECTN